MSSPPDVGYLPYVNRTTTKVVSSTKWIHLETLSYLVVPISPSLSTCRKKRKFSYF